VSGAAADTHEWVKMSVRQAALGGGGQPDGRAAGINHSIRAQGVGWRVAGCRRWRAAALTLAYSPPACSAFHIAYIRSLTSADIRSNDENSERLSASSSFSACVAAACIALMIMLRRCWWHWPMKTLHLASRCAGERASHAASPIASLPAAIRHRRLGDEPLGRTRGVARVGQQQRLLAEPVQPDRVGRRPARRRPAARAVHLVVRRAPLLEQPPRVREDVLVDRPRDRLGGAAGGE
jgi:hypothetical protein